MCFKVVPVVKTLRAHERNVVKHEVTILHAKVDIVVQGNAGLRDGLVSKAAVLIDGDAGASIVGRDIHIIDGITDTATGAQADAVVAANVKQGVDHAAGDVDLAIDIIVKARNAHSRSERNADCGGIDSFYTEFFIGAFGFKTERAKIITEYATGFPTIFVIDEDLLFNTVNIDLVIVREGHSTLDTHIGLAIARIGRHGDNRRSPQEKNCCFFHSIFLQMQFRDRSVSKRHA